VPSADVVGLYSCGPTVYYFPHLGNMRPYVFADTLRRTLRWKQIPVRHVVNITDVGHAVADSDTGVNMLFTMRSALAEANTDAKSADVVKTAAALSAGALNGARGNSGVILSQILRGIADVTARAAADSDDELHQIDAALLGAALHRGVELVVASMGGQEVPGTIVSVLKAAGEAVEQSANAGEGLPRAVTAAGDAAVVCHPASTWVLGPPQIPAMANARTTRMATTPKPVSRCVELRADEKL